jgi:hypothetical protein
VITPAIYDLTAVTGKTFDVFLVVFAEQPPIRWREPVLWAPTKYKVYDAIIGSDGIAYQCMIENHAVNPVGDATGTWKVIPPENLTGWTASGHISTLAVSSPASGITLGGTLGTVLVKASKSQTTSFTGTTPWNVSLTDTSGNEYEYVKGTITWEPE